MDKQKIFNTVVPLLMKQGSKSLDYGDLADGDPPVCVYRSIDGRKCALGFLIKDEFYGKKLEYHY